MDSCGDTKMILKIESACEFEPLYQQHEEGWWYSIDAGELDLPDRLVNAIDDWAGQRCMFNSSMPFVGDLLMTDDQQRESDRLDRVAAGIAELIKALYPDWVVFFNDSVVMEAEYDELQALPQRKR